MADHFRTTIEERKRGKVAVIAIDALPPNNTLSLPMLRGFISAMENAAKQADGILVTSAHPKFFSNGLDGKFLLDSSEEVRRETVTEMIRAFGKLVKIEKPWIVELAGHTMAGGCVISIAADYRFMLSGAGRIGLTELMVGLPLPVVYLHGLHRIVAPHAVRGMLEGAALKPEEALEIGLVDGVAATPEELRSMCMKRLDAILRIEQDSYLPTRRLYRQSLLRQMEADEAEDVRMAAGLVTMPVFQRAVENIAGKNR